MPHPQGMMIHPTTLAVNKDISFEQRERKPLRRGRLQVEVSMKNAFIVLYFIECCIR